MKCPLNHTQRFFVRHLQSNFSWKNDITSEKEAKDGDSKLENLEVRAERVCNESTRPADVAKNDTSMIGESLEVVSGDDVGTQQNQATEIQMPSQSHGNGDKSRIEGTPSGVTNASCGYGQKWIAVDSQDIHGSPKDGDCFRKQKEAKNEDISAATCVTLQVLDMKEKRTAGQRRQVQLKKFLVTSRKGNTEQQKYTREIFKDYQNSTSPKDECYLRSLKYLRVF